LCIGWLYQSFNMAQCMIWIVFVVLCWGFFLSDYHRRQEPETHETQKSVLDWSRQKCIKEFHNEDFNKENFRNNFLYFWRTYFPLDPPVITTKSCTFYTIRLLEFQADRNTSVSVVARLRAAGKHFHFYVVFRPALGLIYPPIQCATVEVYLW